MAFRSIARPLGRSSAAVSGAGAGARISAAAVPRRSFGLSGAISPNAQKYLDMEDKHGAKNYAPLGVVCARGEGPFLYDVDGKKYFDFLSAYSAVNQGHCHPRLVKVMKEQCETLTLTSRAFYNNKLGPFEKYITEFFGYDRVLAMNSGVEACETAVKLARRWAYDVKGVPENKAHVIFAEENFWGRSLAAVSSSTDPESYTGYGPFMPNFHTVPYNDVPALESKIAELGADNVAAFMVEPIQGEAGVVVPEDGYLNKCKAVTEKANALLICDEVQTGLARTGRMLCIDHDGVKPDMIILGKALSGGMMPVSAVLANDEVMLTIKPGQHGSTYGGNPLACAIATEALQILVDEDLAAHADKMGEILRADLQEVADTSEFVQSIRGRGLLNAVIVNDSAGWDAMDVCYALADHGLLAKPTHGNIIRLAPPLVLSEEQIRECSGIIRKVLTDGKPK